MNNVVERIKRYKELQADIVDIDLKIQELETDMLGITEQPQGERTSKTYKITSGVESQAEKYMEAKEQLIKDKKIKEIEIKRIDNAMTILKDYEREVIQTVLIDHKRYALLEVKYNRTYGRIKQIESEAVKKMSKYLG